MKKIVTQRGFTMIELMVVVVILGILVAIGLANLSNANVRARESSVRTNMHSFQTIVEIYGVDHSGFYPHDVSALLVDPNTSQQRLLFNMANPFSGAGGINNAYADEVIATKPAGILTYTQHVNRMGYEIYGYSNRSTRLQHNGNEFVLSNN